MSVKVIYLICFCLMLLVIQAYGCVGGFSMLDQAARVNNARNAGKPITLDILFSLNPNQK